MLEGNHSTPRWGNQRHEKQSNFQGPTVASKKSFGQNQSSSIPRHEVDKNSFVRREAEEVIS